MKSDNKLGRKPFDNRDSVRTHTVQFLVTKAEKQSIKINAFNKTQSIGAYIRKELQLDKLK